MSTYYLNAAGSNTAPYDTSAKGATSIQNIKTYGVSQSETDYDIKVVGDVSASGGTYPWGAGPEATAENVSFTSVDTENKSTITFVGSSVDIMFLDNNGNNPNATFADLNMVFDSANMQIHSNMNLDIQRCTFTQKVIYSTIYVAGTTNSTIVIKNNVFLCEEDLKSAGRDIIRFEALHLKSAVDISVTENTFVLKNTGEMIYDNSDVHTTNGPIDIKDNIFYAETSATIKHGSAQGSNTSYTYNDLYNVTFDFPVGDASVTSDNITDDPIFIDYANNDFEISGTSPCSGTGSTGNNMGYFQPPATSGGGGELNITATLDGDVVTIVGLVRNGVQRGTVYVDGSGNLKYKIKPVDEIAINSTVNN